MWGCFDNCVGVLVIRVLLFYRVLYFLYCDFLLFRLCTFILISYFCTSVRTAATERQLNCSNNNNNNNNSGDSLNSTHIRSRIRSTVSPVFMKYTPYRQLFLKGFKYLGTTLTNQNCIAEEIKSRLRSGNACYHSVQNLLSSSVLSKNLKIKIYRTIILQVVLYGCEAWSLILS